MPVQRAANQLRASNGITHPAFFGVIRSTSCVGEGPKVKVDGRVLIWSGQMTEAVTITNQELAILCDTVAGWSVKRAANLAVDKKQALDRLIAHGYVAPADGSSLATYQHTAKTEVLFAQLCVGISGG
jgi:hypothetical protein